MEKMTVGIEEMKVKVKAANAEAAELRVETKGLFESLVPALEHERMRRSGGPRGEWRLCKVPAQLRRGANGEGRSELSGGQKTMLNLSLLLAVAQRRPSMATAHGRGRRGPRRANANGPHVPSCSRRLARRRRSSRSATASSSKRWPIISWSCARMGVIRHRGEEEYERGADAWKSGLLVVWTFRLQPCGDDHRRSPLTGLRQPLRGTAPTLLALAVRPTVPVAPRLASNKLPVVAALQALLSMSATLTEEDMLEPEVVRAKCKDLLKLDDEMRWRSSGRDEGQNPQDEAIKVLEEAKELIEGDMAAREAHEEIKEDEKNEDAARVGAELFASARASPRRRSSTPRPSEGSWRIDLLKRTALDLREEAVMTDKMADTLNSLGMLRQKQKRYQDAKSYYAKSLQLRQKLGGKGFGRGGGDLLPHGGSVAPRSYFEWRRLGEWRKRRGERDRPDEALELAARQPEVH